MQPSTNKRSGSVQKYWQSAALGAALVAGTTVAHAVTLVENGRARAVIVVARAAVEPDKDDAVSQKINTAAHDLQDYVKKMSGATLPIIGDDQHREGVQILVGDSLVPKIVSMPWRTEEGPYIPSGLTPERKEEGFVIQVTPTTIILSGNDAGPYHGTEYATYEFLNRLGVRWYMPGEYGEVVPTLPTISVGDMAVREKPDFRARNWWLHTTTEMAVLERKWKIRNKMNPDTVFAIPTDSSVTGYTADPAQAKDHPELFAKNFDGSINTTLPNLTNPETVKIAADKIKGIFRKNPDQTSIGMAPADGLPRDFNPETVKRNQGFSDLVGREGVPTEMSATEEWLEWVNAVAGQVHEEFPDHIITTNGYANRNMPPFGVKIDPRVSIMFAAIWSDTIHAYDNPRSWQTVRQGQLLKQWGSLNDKVWVYGYDYTMLCSGLTPVPGSRKLAHDFPLMKKWGIMGFINESRNIWAERGIAMRYLNARLMWNADLNVKTTLDDFYSKWYGAAAQPSMAFWDALEDTLEKTPISGHEDRVLPWVYTPQLVAKLEQCVASAEGLATKPKEKEHVKVDRLILEHMKAYIAMNDADLRGDWTEAVKQGQKMQALRVQLSDINSFLMRPKENLDNGSVDYTSGVFYWSLADRIKYYHALADKLSGNTGSLVAMLPQQCLIGLDPKDEGRFAGWYETNWDTSKWGAGTTDKPFYLQGPKDHPYMESDGTLYLGNVWYQFKVDVPASAKGQAVKLFIPIIEGEAWVWVNGQYAGHRGYNETYVRPNDMDQDVTQVIRPGAKNIVTIRFNTSMNRSACSAGLLSRLFLYSPKTQ